MRVKGGFTMTEVLMVIAIVGVLAAATFYFLNPYQLFQQGTDANRVSDLSTINKAVSLYYSDALNNPQTLYMGSSSVVYISIPDPTATTTAGTNCAGIGLTSTSTTYHCAASSTYRNTNGTGWIPINFNTSSTGSVISSLPVDPVNTTSSGEFFVYTTDGQGGYEVLANPVSSKYSGNSGFTQGTNTSIVASYPSGIFGGGSGSGAVAFTTSTFMGYDPYDYLAFDSHTNTIWGPIGNFNFLTQFSDNTPYVSTTTALPTGSSESAVFDPNTNTVWIGTGNGATLIQINDTTYASSTVYTSPNSTYSVVFDPHTNTIWVPNGNGNGLEKINDTTYATSTVNTSPYYITFDSHTNTIWGTDYSHTVTQINDTTYATSTILLAPGSEPYQLAFDSHTNTIWVTNQGNNTVTQINDTTYATSTIAVGFKPGVIAFDSHTNSIWVGDGQNPTSTVPNLIQINDTTYATSTYNIGNNQHIDAIAFDPHNNTVWVDGSTALITIFTPSQ